MELTVLVDNNTLIDRYFLGEPGFSVFLEDGGVPVLFDTGYSDVVIRNARALNVDLSEPLTVVVSHGHNDHTGGLAALVGEGLMGNKTVVAHPLAFRRRFAGEEAIGSPLSLDELSRQANMELSREPVRLAPRLWFLGEVDRTFPFEETDPMGSVETGQGLIPDRIHDDTALAYQGEEGLFIVTGCSHSGICNIVEQAKKVCDTERVVGIIGGLHLFKNDERLSQTIEYLNRQRLRALYPCHCVSLAVKCALSRTLPVREVGVGMGIPVR